MKARSLLPVVAALVALDAAAACRRGPYNGPITGKVAFAGGSGAPLSTAGTTLPAFALTATLGDLVISAGPQAGWECYPPQPPLFPNYDIVAQEGSAWIFALVVQTAAWHAGTVVVNNSSIRLQLSLPDRYGIGTHGTLTLLSTGSSCGFTVQDVDLFGLEESAKSGFPGGG